MKNINYKVKKFQSNNNSNNTDLIPFINCCNIWLSLLFNLLNNISI